jgi:hypothetical protein
VWAKDASLWSDGPEASWLGWLDIIATQLDAPGHLSAFGSEMQQSAFEDIVLLGMGVARSLHYFSHGAVFRGNPGSESTPELYC